MSTQILSPSPQPQAQSQGEQQASRLLSNSKIIWGAEKDYDFEIETDDYLYYQCMVREDRGYEYGLPLLMTILCYGEEAAWNELDRMLRVWAGQVKSGREMSREEQLSIFGGKKGRYRGVLEQFMDLKEKKEKEARKGKDVGMADRGKRK
ncbi:hypothetical protein K458DRAFT_412948 [Lentithecium fluviatile CBS 122367]|uniref:Uncharacterized protein n=1 Tax=Lentithecium fluviatile CBS 122367 TaxID=1168545 RepID=A0A6G1JIZ6_9PLEO|nr:hypothetical protein K458DRAFT_412948 [Lentithecium fluviatile CBS 122367]